MGKLSDINIQKNIISIKEDVTVANTVEMFVSSKVSSVLITDQNDLVVGILTERDIVRKFTLIDVKDKLTRCVNTIMGRGVKFVSPDSIVEDVLNLHLEFGMRHFPVSKKSNPLISEVEGIVSVSDILRSFLKESARKTIDARKIETPIRVALVAKNEAIFQSHLSSFKGFPIGFTMVRDLSTFVKVNGSEKYQILVDFDGFSQKELIELIPLVGQYRGNKILAMSHPAMAVQLQKMIATNDRNLKVCMKPIDATYCNWLFTEKWKPGSK